MAEAVDVLTAGNITGGGGKLPPEGELDDLAPNIPVEVDFCPKSPPED